MNKIKTTLLVVSAIALIAASFLLWREYQHNKTYETYLSDVLSNKVSQLISNISNVERTLTEVIDNQCITKNQASVLYGNFSGIKDRNKEISDIGVRLDKLRRNKIDRVITTNEKLMEYFKKINDSLSAEETDQLSEEQLVGFQEFLNLVSQYKEIAKLSVYGVTDTGVNGEYWSKYFEDGVENDFWVDLVKELEDVSPDYSELTLLRSNGDVWDIY